MTRKQIRQRVKFWQGKMGLTNWDIIVEFKEYQSKKKDQWGDEIARADTNQEYKFATIFIMPKRVCDVNDEIIIHELLHCLFSPLVGMMYANFKDADKRVAWVEYFHEQVTSETERIIYRMFKKRKH